MSELAELVVAVALAAAAIHYVLRPVLQPGGDAPASSGADDEGDDPEDDLSSGAVALRALREIEFDRATGKLSDADYDALRTKYTALALQSFRTEEPRAPSAVRGAPEFPEPADAHGARLTAHGSRCPTCGPRPESDAAFCSTCGRRLGTAPGYCARCGTALETDARYCSRCGARVAA